MIHHITGVIDKWKIKATASVTVPSVKGSSLAQFRDGLLAALLHQRLFQLEIPQPAKSLWTSIRLQQSQIPSCIHPQITTCACNQTFEPLQSRWPCDHVQVKGEKIGNPNAHLLDISSPPTPVTTFVRICQSCFRLSRATTIEGGIFNADDTILLSVPLLLQFRYLLYSGTPLTNIITSWRITCEALFGDAAPSRLMAKQAAQAYLSFEALTNHGEESGTCAICKDNPQVLIFDGNAKLVFKLLGI